MTGHVRAVCFPHDDYIFDTRVQQLVHSPDSGGPLEAVVAAMLRQTYPLAVISPREALASLDGERTWYVYRDGAFFPPSTVDAS